MNGKPLWKDYVPEARAVLAAIREPSAVMLEAAEEDDAAFLGAPGMIWHRMIDAALKEAE
ncbi:hypothetical protein [Rhizorhabdus histidinilytica]|uniref:hypothetical protein n=1 Tax=Rhizorhabdus histidinilytica TaxID=439228 RepID=UPI00321FA9F1